MELSDWQGENRLFQDQSGADARASAAFRRTPRHGPIHPPKFGHERLLKNVLTEKKGRFLGVLAGKQGFAAKKKTLFFAFFHVFDGCCIYRWLSGNMLQIPEGRKKNRA